MPNVRGKPITDTLGELERGEVLHKLTDAQYEIIEQVMETRKGGTLTLRLDYVPTGRGTVAVAYKITRKVPEHDSETTTFFVDGEHTLLRDHPDQQKLPLRAVETPDNEPLRVVEND
jgi:hypothetical protein